MEQIAFGVISAVLLLSAFQVVSVKNLVHTVLWLGVTLALTAVTFVMLYAPFLAAIQLILYTGGVLTLMLFGVMLTNREAGLEVPNEQHRIGSGALLAVSGFGVLAGAVFKTPNLPDAAAKQVTTQALGVAFLTEHVLAFEVLSILLLAAVLGAIVLARRVDPTADAAHDRPRIAPRRRHGAPTS